MLIAQLITLAAAIRPISTAQPTSNNSTTGVGINVTLADDAVDLLHAHSLWIPNVTDLVQLNASLSGAVNLTEQERELNKSGLQPSDLYTVSPVTDFSVKEAPNGNGVDCGHCHLCEEACVAAIWLPPIFFLCIGPCHKESWCDGCD